MKPAGRTADTVEALNEEVVQAPVARGVGNDLSRRASDIGEEVALRDLLIAGAADVSSASQRFRSHCAINFNLQINVIAFLFSAAVGVGFGYAPARRAARPAEIRAAKPARAGMLSCRRNPGTSPWPD